MTAIPTPRRPLLVTHSGTFHLDDDFAFAVPRLALRPGEAAHDHTLARPGGPRAPRPTRGRTPPPTRRSPGRGMRAFGAAWATDSKPLAPPLA